MTNEANTMFGDFDNTQAIKDAESLGASKKFLTFVSDSLNFAIDADYVIEIINDHNITHLPKTPAFIKGIINLRGQIIPIMDIRHRMSKAQIDYGREACIIVIVVEGVSIGLLVDSVSHMIDVYDSNLSSPPLNNHHEMVSGIARVQGVVYLMLDCQLLLDPNN